jgi:hypothetical protein
LKSSIRLLLSAFAAAGVALAGASATRISLTGTTDTVAFNGSLDTITLGSQGCSTPNIGNCTYSGTQPLGAGSLTWTFTTPNTAGNITWNPVEFTLSGPAGGTFLASDGVDSLMGTYIFSTYNYDDTTFGSDFQFNGIDLNGTITVTGTTLAGGSDPNQGAFESFMDVPGAVSYAFTLDVTDCTDGSKAAACILTPDPTAQFNSLDLTPTVGTTTTPEPGAFGMMAAGLLCGAVALRRKRDRA